MTLEAGEAHYLTHNQVIERPRLTRLLDEATAQIILLIAPAGYGKTTLANEWLKDRPHSWYRGTPAAADVAALALRIARASSRLIPDAGQRLESRLKTSQAPAEEVDDLAELLAEDLAEWPDTHWLAFDDYQFACDSARSERFMEHLAASSPLRLLVASRTRPRWASARRALYGEVFEVGRALLAMDQDEAQAVLEDRASGENSGIVALADGWPALISLATFTREPDVPTGAVPAELYSFFAEELYRAADPQLQRVLRRVALAPYVTSDIAETVIDEDPDRLINRGVELGFFVSERDPLELHPLLRTFLASKFRKRWDDPTGGFVSRLARVLIAREEWDEVFELASQFADDGLLIDLFEASLSQMLDQARLPTLERWIATARSRQLDSAIVALAEAELLFRQGDLSQAEAVACQAAPRFSEDGHFKSRSLWIAGTSAHVSANDEVAAEYFASAERVARSSADAQAARWGRFLAAESLEERQVAERLLEEFEQRCGGSTDELLRIAGGRLLLACLLGTLPQTLAAQRNILPLADRSRDPIICSGYLNTYGWVLVLAGRYEEALKIADVQRELATSHALDFVTPFGFILSAGAQWGLRNFRACRTSLLQCERVTSNGRLLTLLGQLACRLSLAHSRLDEAHAALERTYEAAKVSRSLHAEHLAWWSFAHAVAGNRHDAERLARRAASISQRVDVSGLVPWAGAVSASTSTSATRLVTQALEVSSQSGYIDAFVTAYRSCPRLLEIAAADSRKHEALKLILERARDYTLAAQVGIQLSAPSTPTLADLSKREVEVLDLVCQGLMNKEIARALFITEATVKVHVRKICRKFGVRSRTEAAMRAAELSG